MKKIILVLSAIVISSSFSFAKKDAVSDTAILKTEKDSMSYALGIDVGSSLSQQLKTMPGGGPNIEILTQAISDSYAGKENMPFKNKEEAYAFLEKYFTKMQEVESAAAKKEGEEFLANNKKRKGIFTTESGLQYEVITEGTGARPTAADKVRVHYRGTLIDGTEFDSSYARNEPAEFGLGQVIPGWTEALQLMKEGSKWKIYLPYNLGYGEQGAGGEIKPYSTLIFEVELLNVLK